MKTATALIPMLFLAFPVGLAQEAAEGEGQQSRLLDEVDAATKARATRVLEGVTARLQDVAVMRAAYVQERTSPLLIEPLVSKGVLLQRTEPACLLFQAEQPYAARIRVDDTSYQVYRPDEGTAERFVFEGAHAGRALLSAFRPEAEALFESFALVGFSEKVVEVMEEEVPLAVLTLRPRDEEARKRVDNVVLEIAHRRALPTAVTYVDHEGYSVALKLASIELDPEIEGVQEVFAAELPKGVRVLVHRIGRE